jgi:hypothetical protein
MSVRWPARRSRAQNSGLKGFLSSRPSASAPLSRAVFAIPGHPDRLQKSATTLTKLLPETLIVPPLVVKPSCVTDQSADNTNGHTSGNELIASGHDGVLTKTTDLVIVLYDFWLLLELKPTFTRSLLQQFVIVRRKVGKGPSSIIALRECRRTKSSHI